MVRPASAFYSPPPSLPPLFPLSLSLQVCFPAFLFGEETKTEAGEPFSECGGHGQAALLCLETHDARAEEALRRDGGARQAEVRAAWWSGRGEDI